MPAVLSDVLGNCLESLRAVSCGGPTDLDVVVVIAEAICVGVNDIVEVAVAITKELILVFQPSGV